MERERLGEREHRPAETWRERNWDGKERQRLEQRAENQSRQKQRGCLFLEQQREVSPQDFKGPVFASPSVGVGTLTLQG